MMPAELMLQKLTVIGIRLFELATVHCFTVCLINRINFIQTANKITIMSHYYHACAGEEEEGGGHAKAAILFCIAKLRI